MKRSVTLHDIGSGRNQDVRVTEWEGNLNLWVGGT